VYIVEVQNFGRGENFTQFQQSATCQKASLLGVHIITLGRLHPQVTQKIDFADLSFWAAAHNRDALSITERQRVKVWLKDAYSQIDGLLQQQKVKQTEEI